MNLNLVSLSSSLSLSSLLLLHKKLILLILKKLLNLIGVHSLAILSCCLSIRLKTCSTGSRCRALKLCLDSSLTDHVSKWILLLLLSLSTLDQLRCLSKEWILLVLQLASILRLSEESTESSLSLLLDSLSVDVSELSLKLLLLSLSILVDS